MEAHGSGGTRAHPGVGGGHFVQWPRNRTCCRSDVSRDPPNTGHMPGSRLTSLLREPAAHDGGRPGSSALRLALGLQHRAGAIPGAAAAGPDLFHTWRVRLVEGDAVVVGQLLARLDAADRLDEHAILAAVLAVVLFQHRLAVGRATVVDPARDAAFVVGVDHVLVVEGEQERVSRVGIAGVAGIDLGVGPAAPLVLDDPITLADGLDGEHAIAVDGGATGDDLARHAGLPADETPIVPQPPRWAARSGRCGALGLRPDNPYNSGTN